MCENSGKNFKFRPLIDQLQLLLGNHVRNHFWTRKLEPSSSIFQYIKYACAKYCVVVKWVNEGRLLKTSSRVIRRYLNLAGRKKFWRSSVTYRGDTRHYLKTGRFISLDSSSFDFSDRNFLKPNQLFTRNICIHYISSHKQCSRISYYDIIFTLFLKLAVAIWKVYGKITKLFCE